MVGLALAVARAGGQTGSSAGGATRLQEARDLAAAGRMDAAEQAVKRVLAAEPNRYDALVMLGELLEARGDLAGAAAAYERGVRVRSGSAVAHDKLGFDELFLMFGQGHLEPDENHAELEEFIAKVAPRFSTKAADGTYV